MTLTEIEVKCSRELAINNKDANKGCLSLYAFKQIVNNNEVWTKYCNNKQ